MKNFSIVDTTIKVIYMPIDSLDMFECLKDTGH